MLLSQVRLLYLGENMKQKRWHGSATGNDAESIIDTMAAEAGLTWNTETTVDRARRRKSGSVDRRYKLDDGREFVIEIKHMNTGIYSYKLNSDDHKIKWSQIQILWKEHLKGNEAGFIFMTTDKPPVFVHITDFMAHYTESRHNHIKYSEAELRGLRVDNMLWVKDYSTKTEVL